MGDNTLDIDKFRIYSSIFWVLGAIFSLIVAILAYQKDLQTKAN